MLAVSILYSKGWAFLANPASALDPARLNSTFFWCLAPAHRVPYTVGMLDRLADGLRRYRREGVALE
jgi:hypothetical protein